MNSANTIKPKTISRLLLAVGLWVAPVQAETIIIDDSSFSVANVPSASLGGVLSGRWGIWEAASSSFVQTVTSSLNAGYVDLSSPELSITLNQITALNHPAGSSMALAIFTDGSADAQGLNFASATHRLVLTDASWVAPNWANNANMVTFSFSSNTVARIGSFLFNGGNERFGLAGISHPVILSPAEAAGIVSEEFSYQIEASGAPTGFSASGLPAGLSLNAATGLISGTPAQVGSFVITVGATNSGGTGEMSVTLVIGVGDGQWTILSYPGARSTYVAGLSGSNIVGFYDSLEQVDGWPEGHGFLYNGSNWTQLRPPNAVRSEARGISSNRIVGILTQTNNQKRGYLWTNGIFSMLDYPGSTETQAYAIDGNQIVGDWKDTNSVRRGFLRAGSTWTSLSFPGAVATSARGVSGNRIVGEYTDAFGNVRGFLREGTNWTSLSMTNPIPFPEDPSLTWNATEISAKSLSGNTVVGELLGGAGQSAAFLYQGGRWQIFDPTNRPAAIVYAIEGNRLGGFYRESSETGDWVGFVHTLPAPVVILPDTVPVTNGTPFSLPVTADNAPASFAATNLPPGLTINTSNGLISGTPTWPGEFVATVSASSEAGTGSKEVQFAVANLQLRLPAQGSFSRQLSAPGGAASFTSSNLPGGLSLSASGLLSGTPTNTGYFAATITASNPSGVFTSQIAFTVFRTNLVVTGRVVTPSNTPVANFPLRLVHPSLDRRIFASATTAADGSFTLTAPSDRNYQIVQANITNVNTLPTRFLYPVHVFSDWFGTPVDAGNIQAVPVDRTIQVRMVDAYSGEPVVGTNLSRMGAASLSCDFFPLADPVAIWMLHQIQIRAQKSFWKLTPAERAGLREEATRLVTAAREVSDVEIQWGFLEGSGSFELPPLYHADLGDNWNARTNVIFYQETEPFQYLAKTNASGLYQVPVALMGHDPRVNPWYNQSGLPDAEPEPTCAMQFNFNGPEGVRGKVIARYRMAYEQGFGQPGYLSNNPLSVDLKVRPAPRLVSGNFYRSNGTTAVTNGWVFLSQDIDHPFGDFLSQKCLVDAAGQFQFAAPGDSEDDWRLIGEELSDTLTTAGGENWFTSAGQFLQIRSNDVTGLKLVADQAPAIASIQNGRAGETFRVTGTNLASLGGVTLIPQPSSGGGVVVQPVFEELWTARRETGFVEFGVPDYLPPGSYTIQYRYPNFAANLVPFDPSSGDYGNEGFTTVTATNIFSITGSTNTNSFASRAGEVVRLPIRYGEKRMWSLTLSNNMTGEARMLQPRRITSQYVEVQLPQDDAVLGEWGVVWGDGFAVTSLTLDDPSPVISLQPIDQAVLGGGTANFAVGATGAQPLRYQWTLNGLNVNGATNPSLQITNARAIHQGDYVAVVSNWAGTVTTAVATLSVQQAPQILTQPRGTNLIAGQSYALSVSAEGSEPLAYQWRKGGTNLEGANDSTLAFDSVSSSDAGTYSVLITNAVGSVVSSNAVISVVSPPQFPIQVNGLRGNLGSSLRFAPVVSGSPAIFTLSNAPAGLSVNRTNGLITGTPAVPAYTRFTLVASNLAGTDSLALGLTVPAAPSSLPFLDEFTSVPPTNRYMKLNLGMPASLVWTNQGLRYVAAAGDGDSAIAGWSPTLPLTLTNSWEISLDVQLPDGWETPSAAVGISLFPDTNTLEQFQPNRLHFRLDRDTIAESPGNRFYRCSYADGEESAIVPREIIPTTETRGRLRMLYTTNTRTLHTLYRAGTNAEWVALGDPVDLNPANPSSLAASWVLLNGSGLRLIIAGDSAGADGSAGRAMTLDNLAVRAGQGPAIASHPRGTNVGVGSMASFAVSASGPDPYFYQWRLNGTNLVGETNPVLTRPDAQTNDAGNYSVVVSNLFGVVTSSNAPLLVVATPSFSPQATNGLRGNLGQVFTFQPDASGALVTFSASNLPPGLTLNRTNGRITGTPTAAGYYPAFLMVSNAAGTATLPLAITVPGTRLTFPFSDNFSTLTANRYLPFNFYSPGSMRITNGAARFVSPPDGTNGSTAGLVLNLPLSLTNSWDVSADVTLPNGWETPEVEIGMSLDTMFGTNDTLESILGRGQEIALVLNRDTEIEGANNVRRSVYVGGEDQESLRTTLTNDAVTNARLRFVYQTHNRTLRAWLQTNSATPWVAVGEALDMSPASGGSLAQRWGLSNGSSLFLTLTAYAQGGTGTNHISLDNLAIGVPVAPVITSTGNLVGQVGQPLVYTNRATNGPAEFASTNLPAGLSLDAATGVISGVPTTAGLTNLIVTARTPVGTATRTNTVVILPDFTGTNLVAGIVNDANFRHEVLIGPHNFATNLRFAASNLPAGLAINATSGVISGRPTNAGVYLSSVTLSAWGATARHNLQFTFPAGQGAGFMLVLNPRPASVTNLPAGLSYTASTGVISGIPAAWGSFTALGRFANNSTTNIPIHILPSAPVITSPTNWVVQAGVEAQYQIVAGGVGREWAGYDDFSTNTSKWTLSGIGGTTLLTSSGALANRTTGSNSSQDGLAYWQRLLPRTANWEVWMKAYLPTNAPVVGQDFKVGLLLGNQARNNGQVWEARHLFADGRYVAQHRRLTTLTDTNKLDVPLGSQPRAAYDLALKYTTTDQRLRGFVFDAEGNEITNQIVPLPAGLGTSLTPGIISECNRKPLSPTNTFSADDFLIVPDPGDIEYRAYLVDTNGDALLGDGGQPYLLDGMFCNPNHGTIEGTLAGDIPGGNYRMKVEAVYRPERLPGNSPPVLAGSAIVNLRVIPAGQVTMEFVLVDHPGNLAFNTNGRGRVNYTYHIGKHEVTVGQYATFLNAAARSDFESGILYSPSMAANANAGAILRFGTDGAYRYQILGSPERPAAFVSWQAAARFCNWMENGQGTNSTLTGSYDFSTNPIGSPSGSVVKNPSANFRIPNGNEWFKAAYYDHSKAKYWRYATRSDVRPGNSSLLGANQANFRMGGTLFLTRLATLDSSQNYLTEVGAFRDSASYYGTFDQNGNLDEWIDELAVGQDINRMRWGGAWTATTDEKMKSSDYLPATDNSLPSSSQSQHIGFRILCTTPP